MSIFVAGAAASLLAQAVGWSPWGGLVVALNPGLVFAVNSDTSEALGAALLLLGLAAYVRGRRGWAIGLFAALCFVKEPLVLVPLAIAAWEFWRTRRFPSVVFAVVPAALWWIYLRIHLGAFPFGQGSERLTAPLAGWKRALLDAASQSWNVAGDTAQMGEAAVALIIAVGLAILIGGIYALRMRSVVAPAFLSIALLVRVHHAERRAVSEGSDPRARTRAHASPVRSRRAAYAVRSQRSSVDILELVCLFGDDQKAEREESRPEPCQQPGRRVGGAERRARADHVADREGRSRGPP